MGVVPYHVWSHSRAELWKSCPRAYFIAYLSAGDPGFEIAPLLAHGLKTLPMLVGWIVDDAIRDVLQSIVLGQSMPSDLSAHALEQFALQIADSPRMAEVLRHGVLLPKGRHVLLNDYYQRQTYRDEVEAACHQVHVAVTRFLSSELFLRIRRCEGRGYIIPSKLASRFRLGGITVLASPDFMMRTRDRLLIVDWKVGSRTAYSELMAHRQLGVYGMYALRKRLMDRRGIFIQAAWLREAPKWEPEALTETLLELTVCEIIAGSRSVAARLTAGRDRLGFSVLKARQEDFPAHPEERKCSNCRFLRLCNEGSAIGTGIAEIDSGDNEKQVYVNSGGP